MNIARVLFPIPTDEPFSYLIPEILQESVTAGSQVVAPFGNGFQTGIVLEVKKRDGEEAGISLKEIHDVVWDRPYVQSELLELIRWISEYYVAYLGEALRLIHPAQNMQRQVLQVRLAGEIPAQPLRGNNTELLENLSRETWSDLPQLEKHLGIKPLLPTVQRLRQQGIVETRYLPPTSRRTFKEVDEYHLNPQEQWPAEILSAYQEGTAKKSARANSLIDFLDGNQPCLRPQIIKADYSDGLVKRLVEAGVILRQKKTVERVQENAYSEPEKPEPLTGEQQEFAAIVEPYLENPGFAAFLLHGITGSGKTRIYIDLILRTLARGKQAIVLIPEIVLTPQMMSRFRRYLGEKVAVIHSRLSAQERQEILHKAREGRFSVVMGPRSAIFAPLPNLGLIVVDEEHEPSYKQNDAVPRYNARDVAVYRAHLNNIPIVLGSATPSIESLFNAREERYRYFYLGKRINTRHMPRIHLVDLKTEWQRQGEMPVFSENLMLKMEARLVCKEQAILLQNRRGFSPFIQCNECGHIERCPNCDITLTYHKHGRRLICHYCNYDCEAPSTCPNCNGFDILFKGIGTQKIEEMGRERFAHARFLRMDQDTTRGKGDHGRILQKFRDHQADFLIGTKMIAKGLDFEQVTLVGVMNADQGLQFPDFRASEKVFQLLVQAAGRAGRGSRSGEVLIQTFDPLHYIFKYLMQHDYRGFYDREVETRRNLEYPPFSRLALVRILGPSEEQVYHFGRELARFLWAANEGEKFQVLGPAPAPLMRINNIFRYQILIKQNRRKDPTMRQVRRILKESIYKNPDLKKWPVKVQIDVDPLEIL
ncbi:MAG: primosomal protein N' [Calditrichaeota bacterium]|nr:primosomal protein N' [Calditrichota bacterium]